MTRRAQLLLAAVISIDIAWMLVALASSPARPLGRELWHGEGSAVELLEVALIVVYGALWLSIAWRLRGRSSRLGHVLALAMVVQLGFLASEELDFCGAVGYAHRNLRQASRGIVPDILDTPMLSVYLLAFLFAPLVPLASVRGWLERASPVRAERTDALAALAGILGTVVVFFVVGDQELGELQQLIIYAVLGVITVRIFRRTRTS